MVDYQFPKVIAHNQALKMILPVEKFPKLLEGTILIRHYFQKVPNPTLIVFQIGVKHW